MKFYTVRTFKHQPERRWPWSPAVLEVEERVYAQSFTILDDGSLQLSGREAGTPIITTGTSICLMTLYAAGTWTKITENEMLLPHA